MPRIFLSYRRADSLEATGRIYDRLVECFGPQSVFRDLDSIPLGMPFPQLLSEALAKTDVVLVIIGPTWLSVQNEAGQRRLDQPDDFVHLEVAEALRLGRPVTPVTVSNGRLPTEHELPESIRGLALRNGTAVRPDPDFHSDMDRLCLKLQETLGLPQTATRSAEAINEQLQKLATQNEQLKYELEVQRQLDILDRDWNQTLQSYRAFGNEPTFLLTAFAVVVGVVAGLGFVVGLTAAFGSAGLGLAIFPLMVGGGNVVFHVYRYQNFETRRKSYLERRRRLTSRDPHPSVGSNEFKFLG